MALLKVAQMGNPVLRQIAKLVKPSDIKTKEFQSFINDMIETMFEYDGVGLAAPQVHQSIRVCVVNVDEENPRYEVKESSGLHVFINPEVEILTKEISSSWEGCLSVAGLRGLVSRFTEIKVKYLDREGRSKEVHAKGFLATVLQHEFDHLDGKLYIDRITDMTKLSFDREFEKYWLS